ncbi:Arc family DNA-binding protein [Acetobacter sp. P5B1]|uniref:Arc family DNA-binding protein n=1 Tax=Acetobacter sp. P5B1 TaxID=2762620 RepID=UPI001C04B5A7|nr:Arc family DNA-binding protein [Acetobacter sp. P5B1]
MKQRHDDPQFKFRMPPDMKAALEESAKRSNRTLTAEILTRLNSSLSQRAVPDVSSAEDMDEEERVLVLSWRALGSEEKRSLMVLLRAAIANNDAS